MTWRSCKESACLPADAVVAGENPGTKLDQERADTSTGDRFNARSVALITYELCWYSTRSSKRIFFATPYFFPFPFLTCFFPSFFTSPPFFSSATGPPCVSPSALFFPFLPFGL